MTNGSSEGRGRGGWLLPGAALAVAAVALFVATVPNVLGPAASPSPEASTPDPYTVVTARGVFRFGVEDSAFVIRETRPSGDLELLRLPVSIAPGPAGSPTLSGGAAHGLACGTPGTADYERVAFGRASFRPSGRSVDQPLIRAAAGAGSVAGDGLFLFVIDPGVPDAGAAVSVLYRGKLVAGIGARAFEDISTTGSLQPSGCRLSM